DAEVAGRGKHESVVAGRALPFDLLLGQDRIGRSDLVRAGRKVPAGEDDDGSPHAGEGFGQDGERHAPVRLPGEVVEVQRIEGAGARRARLLADVGPDPRRIAHLRERRSEDHRRVSAAAASQAAAGSASSDSMRASTWRPLSSPECTSPTWRSRSRPQRSTRYTV